MGVAAGGGEALVAERLLHEVSQSAAVERMGGVRVPKPVRGDAFRGAGPPCGLFDDASELRAGEWLVRLLRAKHRVAGRIAVKVINHLGDEVMQVFKVER